MEFAFRNRSLRLIDCRKRVGGCQNHFEEQAGREFILSLQGRILIRPSMLILNSLLKASLVPRSLPALKATPAFWERPGNLSVSVGSTQELFITAAASAL